MRWTAFCTSAALMVGPAFGQGVVPTVQTHDTSAISAINGPVPPQPGTVIIGGVGIDPTNNSVKLVDGQTLTGSCSSNCAGTALIAPFDITVSATATIDLQVISAGSGQINWQTAAGPICNSASQWDGTVYFNGANNDGLTTQYPNPNFNQSFSGPAFGKCMRLWITSYSSGSYFVIATLHPYARHVFVSSPISTQSFNAPYGAVLTTYSTVGTTGATSVSMPATQYVTQYACSIDVTSAGGTGPVTVTLSGGVGNTQSWIYNPATEFQLARDPRPCIQASAQNSPLTLSVPALGAGANVAVTIRGYAN